MPSRRQSTPLESAVKPYRLGLGQSQLLTFLFGHNMTTTPHCHEDGSFQLGCQSDVIVSITPIPPNLTLIFRLYCYPKILIDQGSVTTPHHEEGKTQCLVLCGAENRFGGSFELQGSVPSKMGRVRSKKGRVSRHDRWIWTLRIITKRRGVVVLTAT